MRQMCRKCKDFFLLHNPASPDNLSARPHKVVLHATLQCVKNIKDFLLYVL